MKRTIALLLALAMMLLLCACEKEDKKAFDNADEAFDYITAAYLATNAFSKDIYEAWYMGVNDKFSYNETTEFDDFAAELHVEQIYLEAAVAHLSGKSTFELSQWTALPGRYGDSHFSAWVSAVSEAYRCSGKTVEIEEQLNAAKKAMKALSSEYADYEHYPALKEYFTNTMAFYDFCCHPEGSFEQVVETFNAYRNTARECFFDLNYVFDDSIRGLSAYDDAEDEEDEE